MPCFDMLRSAQRRARAIEATARAWVAAMTYLDGAHQSLLRAAWDG
jgi:hypothetical protein